MEWHNYQRMESLPTDIDALQTMVRQLLDENAALKAQIATLEAQLQTDSHHSHKPPSSDGLRKRPALPRPAGRKKGGQRGHSGKTLTMVASPDHTIVCKPEVCSCGMSLQETPRIVIERRQVFDLPEPKLDITEYQRVRCDCPACERPSEGQFPAHVPAPTQYGHGVLALATLLNTVYLLPFKKIHSLFADLFGYAINESTLVTATTRCYDALAPSEAVIQAQVQASPVCHVDETGLRVAGRLHWQHVVATRTASYLFVHAKRGAQALQSAASLLPTYRGWIVHDCWASYFRCSSCQHALCGAHLLRELTAVAERGSRWARQMHRVFLALYRYADVGRGQVTHPQRWSSLYDAICARAQREEPPATRHHRRGKVINSPGRNLLARLMNHKAAVLAFALHAEVPFTNNQAERDLRPVKVKQKIAGSFRTLVGAHHYARIQSFLATARKQHRLVFKELRCIFGGTSFLLEPQYAK